MISRENRIILDIDRLDIHEGEVLAIIGPNGAGKTTLLLTLDRLIKPDSGQLYFQGIPVETIDELKYRRMIGLVMQDPLLLDMNVLDNVMSGLRFRRMARYEIEKRAKQWLQQLGITHLKDRPARRLSGGEAQRVSLARAFALHPKLVLLDEPFAALDTPTRIRLLKDLKSLLASTGVSAVFITHDQDEALMLGERVAVLLDGRLRQQGSPQEVFSKPVDEHVAAFVGVEIIIPAEVADNQEGILLVNVDGVQLEAVGDVVVGKEVLVCLRPEDVTLWPNDFPFSSSARNRIAGRISRIVSQGALVHVELDCGFPLSALITRSSARDLGLVEDQKVLAVFKASAIHIIPR